MSALGLALVLAAACCHAIWNVLVKRANGGPELIWLFSVVSVLLYLPLAAWIVLVDRPVLGLPHIGAMVGSTLLHLGYFLLLQTGYRKGDLSLVYPTARATGPVLAVAFAVAVLGETLTLQMALGGGMVVFGVFMLTGGIGRRDRAVGASLGYGLGTAVLIGSYTVWDAHAVSVLMVPPLLLDYASNIGRVILLAPLASRRKSLVWTHWRDRKWTVVAIAVLSPLAYILVLYALTFTPVAYVAPTREVSVLLTVLVGSLLLGEGRGVQRLGWAAVILAGIATLTVA